MDHLELLKTLVEVDSSNIEGANQCIEICAEYLKACGISGEIYENQGVKSYVSCLGYGNKTLVFNGHLDVVSGKNNQFEPILINSRLYGRGTADMKGGVVALIDTFVRLKDEKLENQVMLQLVADEEIGGYKGTGYLTEKGFLGDFVICTEPTNMKIALKAKGILRVDIQFHGKSAHGSRPWEGDNAILKAFKEFKKIEELPILKKSNKYYSGSSINLAFIEGGDIYNRVPDIATIGLDIRYVPSIDPNDIIEAIRSTVNGEVKVITIEPGIDVDEKNDSVVQFSKAIDKRVGSDSNRFIGQHGSSDGRYFSSKGIPSIEFGPIGESWHGDDEFVDINSLDDLVDVLVDFSLNF